MDFYVGETAVMRLPYLYQSLNRENSFSLTPGYRSVWGGYLLTTTTFPLTDKLGATLRLDYYSNRGAAVGLGLQWPSKRDSKSWGRFTAYGLHDANPDENETALAREAISSERYRVSLQARQYITDDIYASVNINKLSDTRFLQDFFVSEFVKNPHPDNSLSVTKFADDYTVTLLARKQANEFFDGTERLPEGALDITRQSVFGSKVFYEGETTGGTYRKNFSKGSAFPDYGYSRLDTFHQFLFPRTYMGWLSVVPRVGFRGTWYSETGNTMAFPATTAETLNTEVAKNADGTINRLMKTGSVFRPVFNTGVETSFKISKAYETVQSRALGLDGLRHIIQPYANLSYVTTDSNGKELFQIDSLQNSSQLPAIDFPVLQRHRLDHQLEHPPRRRSQPPPDAPRRLHLQLAGDGQLLRHPPGGAKLRLPQPRHRQLLEHRQPHPLRARPVGEPVARLAIAPARHRFLGGEHEPHLPAERPHELHRRPPLSADQFAHPGQLAAHARHASPVQRKLGLFRDRAATNSTIASCSRRPSNCIATSRVGSPAWASPRSTTEPPPPRKKATACRSPSRSRISRTSASPSA